MSYNDQSALYAFNSFVWKLLEANLGWQKVNGRPPIIPASDEPEIQSLGKAYIIYGAVFQPTPATHSVMHASYIVRGPTATEVNKIVNLLTIALNREDMAADDVNGWTSTEKSQVPSRSGIIFTNVSVLMAGMAEPVSQEGGWTAGSLLIRLQFIQHKSVGDASKEIQTTGFVI